MRGAVRVVGGGNRTGGQVDFKKGAIAAVREARGSGELLVLLRPRELETIALDET